MLASTQSPAGRAANGFPHLSVIKESIKLLYKQLSPRRMKSFSKSLSPSEVEVPEKGDIDVKVQSLAGIIARHLQLPKACIVVNFRDMDNPGRVELTGEGGYLVDLQTKYRNDHRDIGAVLAHEVTHVFLYRHGIQLPDILENELLTDTAAAYLGVGWLCLNAHRVTMSRQERNVGPTKREIRNTTKTEQLGYLTPDEFGYVLRKRSLAFGEEVDSAITSPAARSALYEGSTLAFGERWSAPIEGCSWWEKWGYFWNRRYVRNVHQKSGLTGNSHRFGGYQFEVADSMRVIFECPVCSQKLRLPTDKRVVAYCSVCETSINCST